MGDVQAFERHRTLAAWIAKMPSVGYQFAWGEWRAFLREINRALTEERRRADAIEAAGNALMGALDRYGFPVSVVASEANMSVEARNLHNAARSFQVAMHSTGSIASTPPEQPTPASPETAYESRKRESVEDAEHLK